MEAVRRATSMELKRGMVVEVAGLDGSPQYNGQRGILGEFKQGRHILHLDSNVSIKIKPAKLSPVFCLGIPVEYWVREAKSTSEHDMIRRLTDMCDVADDFHKFCTRNEHGAAGVLINIRFFEMAMKRIDSMKGKNLRHNLRVYCVDKSQNETNLIFDACCAHVPKDMAIPWCVDFSPEQVHELATMSKANL